VLSLKEKLFDQEGTEPDRQWLIFLGKPLEDDKTLADYNINQDVSLHFIARRRPADPIHIFIQTLTGKSYSLVRFCF
jgi:hypothetical protein